MQEGERGRPARCFIILGVAGRVDVPLTRSGFDDQGRFIIIHKHLTDQVFLTAQIFPTIDFKGVRLIPITDSGLFLWLERNKLTRKKSVSDLCRGSGLVEEILGGAMGWGVFYIYS